MKKIFTNLFLIFVWPFLKIKKIKLNTFVGGLIFGALFSLLVNIATIQVQETIQRQRILEAIENEILNNVIQANNTIKLNDEALQRGDKPNFFYTTRKYNRDIWEQTSEPLRYLVQLDQDVQIPIISFYTIVIPGNNQLLERLEDLRKDKLANCYRLDDKIVLSLADETMCKSWYDFIIESDIRTAENISKQGFEILKIFNPTKDRLRNPFLKFLIGDKSTRVLSGE